MIALSERQKLVAGGMVMILADKITEERKKNGWSQEELADKLGVSRQAVSKWESAGSVPDLQRIIQLAELFGLAPIIFLGMRWKWKLHPFQVWKEVKRSPCAEFRWKRQMIFLR